MVVEILLYRDDLVLNADRMGSVIIWRQWWNHLAIIYALFAFRSLAIAGQTTPRITYDRPQEHRTCRVVLLWGDYSAGGDTEDSIFTRIKYGWKKFWEHLWELLSLLISVSPFAVKANSTSHVFMVCLFMIKVRWMCNLRLKERISSDEFRAVWDIGECIERHWSEHAEWMEDGYWVKKCRHLLLNTM